MNRKPKPPDPLRERVVPLSEPLAASVAPLLWTFNHVVMALNVSRRTLERERSAGRFPPPDLHIGKRPMWRPETIRGWIDGPSHKGV
jgi:hypothetical protein